MRPTQKFTKQYLAQTQGFTPEQALQFLENFRKLQGLSRKEKSILISIKIPESLLLGFRAKAEGLGLKYQTQVKELMKDWVKNERR